MSEKRTCGGSSRLNDGRLALSQGRKSVRPSEWALGHEWVHVEIVIHDKAEDRRGSHLSAKSRFVGGPWGLRLEAVRLLQVE